MNGNDSNNSTNLDLCSSDNDVSDMDDSVEQSDRESEDDEY